MCTVSRILACQACPEPSAEVEVETGAPVDCAGTLCHSLLVDSSSSNLSFSFSCSSCPLPFEPSSSTCLPQNRNGGYLDGN